MIIASSDISDICITLSIYAALEKTMQESGFTEGLHRPGTFLGFIQSLLFCNIVIIRLERYIQGKGSKVSKNII